jgi:WD40 repeat protein
VVTASEDGSARVWDARDGTLLAALEGHANALTAVAVSPDDRRVVTTSRDGTARVWNDEVTRDPLGYFCRELAWMSPRAGAATEALEAPEVLEARGLCHVRRPRP